MKIAFITDGGFEMGMGHVYRTLSLAEELKQNVEICFLTKSDKIVVNKIEEYGFQTFNPENDDEIISKLEDIKPDVVIIDKLNVDESFVKSIRENLKTRIVIFDNLSPANKYADVVVNAIIGSNFKNKKYFDRTTNTLYFCGPRYLVLRKEFYNYRKGLKKKPNEIKKLLLIFGGSDPSNLTSKVLDKILTLDKELEINVVIGPHFLYLKELNEIVKKHKERRETIKVYKDAKKIAKLMYETDLVITSPGLSMFESLFIGTPVIAIYQNLLQKRIYQNFFNKIGKKAHVLNLSDIGFLIDPEDYCVRELHIGSGKMEIVEAITNSFTEKTVNANMKISIRQATDDDLELMMAWRSNPLVYKYFYSQKEPLRWEEHYNWWKSREDRIDWIIILHEGDSPRAVGSVNASRLSSGNPEIGIYIGEFTLWGKGIGRNSILLIIEWLKNMGYRNAHARIMKNNLRSVRLFESVGFKRKEEGRKGEWIYEIELTCKKRDDTNETPYSL